jgi:inorganic pyrophosphatase
MTPRPFERFRPHPWHGLSIGPEPPRLVHAFIEITPFDGVKYEVDKPSGYLRVDRPQLTSSLPPTLYGFIPRTYCASRVAVLSQAATHGDGDPLDICVLSERAINRAEILLNARVIGGLRMVDHGEADDKIIAVLEKDPVWGGASELSDVPPKLIERLRHYFMTYKLKPGEDLLAFSRHVTIEAVYSYETAAKVIEAAQADYAAEYDSGPAVA